jgi:glycerol uptake facilitator-like aquaporin
VIQGKQTAAEFLGMLSVVFGGCGSVAPVAAFLGPEELASGFVEDAVGSQRCNVCRVEPAASLM